MYLSLVRSAKEYAKYYTSDAKNYVKYNTFSKSISSSIPMNGSLNNSFVLYLFLKLLEILK